jgi:pimeloyl-ACP methyl ester carboxylesterase
MPELRLSDGALIAYEDVGIGRPLLLVHGWGTRASFFAPQLDGLADGFRLIAPDLRGHGQSRAQSSSTDIPQLATDITELAEALDLTGILAIGWSMGAMVLWQALLEGGLRRRTAGLVSIDMAPKVLNGTDWACGLRGSHPAKAGTQALDLMRHGWAAVAPRIAARIFAQGQEAERAVLRRWAAMEIAGADPVAMASLWASLTALDFRDRLPGLDLPVLVSFGLLSRLYPAETASILAGLLPRSHLLGFPRSGHAPQLEEPSSFNQAIRDFAARLPASTDNDK